MSKKVIIIFIFFIFFNFSFAQRLLTNNLVVNPSFESYTQCPYSTTQISFAYPWSDCFDGNGSSDFYNTCSTSSNILQDINIQKPRTGNGMAGIGYFGLWIGHNYREYLMGELVESLKKNKQYCGVYYSSLMNYSRFAVENLAMYFSVDTVYNSNATYPLTNLMPQIENHKGIIIDTVNWVKINGAFIADGDEKYVTIGNFKDNAHTNYFEVNYWLNIGYYYIDDVSVCECSFEFSLGKDTTLCDGQTLILNPNMPNAIYTWQDSSHATTYSVNKPGTYWVRAYFPDYGITTSSSINVTYDGECLKIPNVITPNNDGKNDYFVIENSEGWNIDVQIFNRWGNIVYQNNTYKNTWDGKDVSDGVYYYIIKATNNNIGSVKNYKGSVTVLR